MNALILPFPINLTHRVVNRQDDSVKVHFSGTAGQCWDWIIDRYSTDIPVHALYNMGWQIIRSDQLAEVA